MPGGDRPSGLLITRSATTAMTQAMAMLEYSPSTSPSAWNTFISISMKAMSVLNTTHTTRPGWLCVRREEIGPRERARIGVGHVDLQLRDHDEQRRRGHRPPVMREHVLVGGEVHLVGVDRPVRGHHVLDREVRKQRSP